MTVGLRFASPTVKRKSAKSHLTVMQLADSEKDPNELLSATKRITDKYDVRFYAYNQNLAYCARCQKVFFTE